MRLKELRTSRNLTQKEVAKELKVAPTTYLGYEKGTSEPSIENLIKLADYFKVSVDFLLDRQFGKQTTQQEDELIDTFEQLPNLEQGMVLGYAKKTLEQIKLAKEKELKNKLKNNK